MNSFDLWLVSRQIHVTRHDGSRMELTARHPSAARQKCKPIQKTSANFPFAIAPTLRYRSLMFRFVWLFFPCAWLAAQDLPEPLTPTLQAAGDNRTEVIDAWNRCPKEQKPGLAFLLQHMPQQDARQLKADFLLENIDLAYRARKEMPWGKDVPEEIFFNDVLPYASLDEARDPWRAKFYEMFRPLVADAPNATVALERIHARITPTLGVQYNTKRRAPNQGPFESMERKMATCTGLSILLTDVARAVCIPARIVGIAEWTTKQGNHNWNEVWLPERRAWVATEYDRDQHGLDRGWYLADAARAIPGSLWHGIYATSWARTAHHFPMVWNLQNTSIPAIEVTQRYVEIGRRHIPAPGQCELRIDVVQRLPDGSSARIARPVQVRQGDIVIAQGISPSPTNDLNQFFTAKVAQGMRYQIALSDTLRAKKPTFREIMVKPTDPHLHIKIELAPSP